VTTSETSPVGRLAGLPRPGEVLAGKYSVEAVLGVGGMAVVVAARHIELDDRVALKILLPRYRTNDEIVARFRREARAAVKIKSEHVARVHDVGALDDGAPCLVMEYLEGQDLETLLGDQGPVARENAVDYLLQACEALAEAHGLGIIHRDLKPANLFLSQRADGKPIIKLLDFGISKVAGVGMGLTRKQASFGTPHYMSPEQLRATDQVDPRADIWAAGAILHELITGRPPFDAEDLTELQQLIKFGEPSHLCTQVPDAPTGLEKVILKALEKDPDARYSNIADLATALAPYGSSEATRLVERVKGVAETARHRMAVTDSQQRPALQNPATPIAFMPISQDASLRQAIALDALKGATRTSISVDPPKETPVSPRAAAASGVVLALVGLASLYGITMHYRGQAAPPPAPTVEAAAAAPVAPAVPVAAASVAAAEGEDANKPQAAAAASANLAASLAATNTASSAKAAVVRTPTKGAPRPAAKPKVAGDRVFDDRK
jgi:serine/threonine protein kinase